MRFLSEMREINTFAATDTLARQHGATSHAGDALGRQSSMTVQVLQENMASEDGYINFGGSECVN